MGLRPRSRYLKPGKPKNVVSSLRGIRLLSSLFDSRARSAWSPGQHQLGFRGGLGCSEAVILLIALVLSRISKKQRLLVLWIDLRAVFSALNSPIVIQKMLGCGLGIGLCRMMIAMLDLTQGIVCNGNLLSKPFQRNTRCPRR